MNDTGAVGVGVGVGGGGGDERGRRPQRHPPSAEAEAEMRLYLDKLKEIVPHIPKNRRVTRLEVIQHVIDYICDLQHALRDEPRLLAAPAHAHAHAATPAARQPLGVLSTTNTLQTASVRRDLTKAATNRINGSVSHTFPGNT